MSEAASAFLQVRQLSKQVITSEGQIDILKNINLTVEPGETIAIEGVSGSGKTTLLTLLAGLGSPTSGDIYFKGHHLNALNEEERALIRRDNIGFIFQSFQLLPTLTALENVMLPLEIQSMKIKEAKELATDWLRNVGLAKRLKHYPAQLSGGEQQRVAIARAFVTEPDLIFADEMTGNLDVHTGRMVMDLIFSLQQAHGNTFVLVTHDPALAGRCARRVRLREGELENV